MTNYIFDLDATLYQDNGEVEAHCEELIDKFFMTRFQMDEEETSQARKRILQHYHYEAAVMGEEFPASKKEFMDYICDVDVSHLPANPELNKLLQQLNGRLLINTDSTSKHTGDTLSQIEVDENLFERIFVAEDNNFLFKFQEGAFTEFCRLCHIEPQESIIFEDSLRNIKRAKEIGMTTVLISKEPQEIAQADYQFANINQALEYFLQA